MLKPVYFQSIVELFITFIVIKLENTLKIKLQFFLPELRLLKYTGIVKLAFTVESPFTLLHAQSLKMSKED